MQLDLRPIDFGNGGFRKFLDAIVAHYRTGSTSTNTQLLYSVDLEQEYSDTSGLVIRPIRNTGTNLSDSVGRDIVTIRHNIGRRRGGYFSVRIQNAGMDENIEIAGIEYKIGGLTEKGFTQAAQTS